MNGHRRTETPPEVAPRVLVVDDDPAVCYTCSEILEAEGFEVSFAHDGVEALLKYELSPVPLVVADLCMPNLDGMQLLKKLSAYVPAPKVVIITGCGSERRAVEAIKANAHDYLRKPFENHELLSSVHRAFDTERVPDRKGQIADEPGAVKPMLFVSEPMRQLSVLVERVAQHDVTVLITGESGTGKERIAESIVRASNRSNKPFVRLNCAALSAELAEAELFGHTKGAFTGAIRARPGLFAEADGGTVLLDEVGELNLATQAKLLRLLQEGEVRPVGEERTRRVNVRILAATHKNLEQLVEHGTFREDLFYRLNVIHLNVPPLRERTDDIVALTQYFLRRTAERAGVSPRCDEKALLDRVLSYRWPGNVRELEHAIESLIVLSPAHGLDLSLLPSGGAMSAEAERTLKERLNAYERDLILEALRESDNNRSVAAARLGISRVTFHDKLNKLGLSGLSRPARAADDSRASEPPATDDGFRLKRSGRSPKRR